jgi:hypothetical protein
MNAKLLKPCRAVLGAILASNAAAAQTTTAPELGPVLLELQGKGDQVYTCQTAGDTPAWVLDHPDASLRDSHGATVGTHGATVGTHGAGPTWHYNDGSSVQGTVLEKTPAQAPSSIPWLLLRASKHEGSGILTQVDTIQRTDTHGGAAPSTGCDAAHLGAQLRVPYTATYTFRARP